MVFRKSGPVTGRFLGLHDVGRSPSVLQGKVVYFFATGSVLYLIEMVELFVELLS